MAKSLRERLAERHGRGYLSCETVEELQQKIRRDEESARRQIERLHYSRDVKGVVRYGLGTPDYDAAYDPEFDVGARTCPLCGGSGYHPERRYHTEGEPKRRHRRVCSLCDGEGVATVDQVGMVDEDFER